MSFFVRVCLDTLHTTPMPAIVTMSEVFPADTRGSGSPVGGMQPLTSRALSALCTAKASVMPPASRKP